jgi:hypothetical protein
VQLLSGKVVRSEGLELSTFWFVAGVVKLQVPYCPLLTGVFILESTLSWVSVRFWPSCVEVMQLLWALRFCRRVDLVGKNVVSMSSGDSEIEAGQQLCQRFTFSAFQHRQCVSPLVSHCDTFRERRNDSDADSALFDCLFDVWEVRGGVFV